MTEFETQLLSVLNDIRDELRVASMPEELRQNQREVIAISQQQDSYDNITELSEELISSHLDKLIKLHPNKEYEELLKIDDNLQRLDKREKDIHNKWKRNEERLEQLCKRGCYHPEFIFIRK